MNFEEFLVRIPKAELHCHLEGSLRATTLADLAHKYGEELPTADVDSLYTYDNIFDFLRVYVFASNLLRTRGDFARATYETLQEGAQLGNLRYRELSFNPTNHAGVPYRTMLDGLLEGARAAQTDFGVVCRFMPAINRAHGPDAAVSMVEEVVQHRIDEVLGIGADDVTEDGKEAPERFVAAYELAGRHGLRRTSHIAEIPGSPPSNLAVALDLLGCDRVDHAYRVMDDAALVERMRDTGTVFTGCPTSTSVVYEWHDLANHPIKAMVEAGLRVTLNSDDPPMFGTDIGREYRVACPAMGFDVATVRELCLNGIDGSWLDDDERRRFRKEFENEFDELSRQIDDMPSGPANGA